MSYLVLARKWRPRTFSEIVGQEHVVRALTNALDSERLHHAYLFAGTRGVGKTTIARILAKALNCASGTTAEPCGTCGACREIDDGRFVDLIEVDAASRTKVDDTRDLLDNVQFAPSGGRYKVYLIDEVHMLTRHSFNALLKTLEEPPPHVKFLLATTDPQKLPVTVLSRCLQFNLKRLTPRLIRDRLEFICREEGTEADSAALTLIARAADGSLRDALSLLDQAIAYCGGRVDEQATADMLGTIDRQQVGRIATLLAERNAEGLMQAVAELDTQVPDYEQLLNDLARLLQRVAVHQIVGREADDEDLSTDELRVLADAIPAEDLQLFYQIAITGRRDLHLAPDPRSGIEMTLLRMLAFQPASSGASVPAPESSTRRAAKPPPASVRESAQPTRTGSEAPSGKSQASARKTGSAATWQQPDWSRLVEALDIQGAVRLLASNCALVERSGNELRLLLDRSAESYLTRTREQTLADALSKHFGESLNVCIEIGEAPAETPMQAQSRRETETLEAARQSLESDPNVKTIIDVFGATLNSDSVRVVDK